MREQRTAEAEARGASGAFDVVQSRPVSAARHNIVVRSTARGLREAPSSRCADCLKHSFADRRELRRRRRRSTEPPLHLRV